MLLVVWSGVGGRGGGWSGGVVVWWWWWSGGLIGIDFSDFTDKIMESAGTAMTRLRTLV